MIVPRLPRCRPILFRIVLLVGCLVGPLPALTAQEEEELFIPFEGTQAFVHLLGQARLEALPDLPALKEADPNRTLVILFGRPQGWDHVRHAVGGWKSFLQRGGALLIASDHPDGGRLKEIGVIITGQQVRQVPDNAYQKRWEHIPLVDSAGWHPLMRGMFRPLAALRPSPVDHEEEALDRIGFFGIGSWVWEAGILDVGGQGFAVGSRWDHPPAGRVLVLGGHGLFMNGMIVRPDCDNWVFAANAIRWLKEGPEGPRTSVFFMESGTVVPDLDVPLGTPLPPIIPPVAALNSLIKGLEEDKILQRYLYDYFGRAGVLQPWILGTALFVVVFGVRRLWKARHRQDHQAVLHVGLQAPQPPALPQQHQRETVLLQRGDFREPTAWLVRAWLQRRCGIPLEAWSASAPPTIPEPAWQGGFFARQRAGRSWRWLLELAAPSTGGKVSRRGLLAVQRTLAELDWRMARREKRVQAT